MTGRFKFLFFFLSIGIFFSQCSKFEDGRSWSIRSVKGRLVKGSPWVFEKLEVDGVDKSSEFRADSSFVNSLHFNDPTKSRTSDEFSLSAQSNICSLYGNFKYKKPNKIEISLLEDGGCSTSPDFDDYYFGPIFRSFWIEWEITRLTMKEIQMKTSFQNQEYKLYLKSNR